MLTVNGLKFAKTKDEFVSTLFNSGGTAYGFYRKLKNGVKLMDMQKTPIMFICTNEGNPFIVSCSVFNGKTRYFYGLASQQAPDYVTDKTIALEIVADKALNFNQYSTGDE